MKRVVILKGSLVDSMEEYVLGECLKIMFPQCDIEILSNPPVNDPDERIRMKPDQNRFVS